MSICPLVTKLPSGCHEIAHPNDARTAFRIDENNHIKEEPTLDPYVICNGFNSRFCTEVQKRKHSIIQVSNLIKQKKLILHLMS